MKKYTPTQTELTLEQRPSSLQVFGHKLDVNLHRFRGMHHIPSATTQILEHVYLSPCPTLDVEWSHIDAVICLQEEKDKLGGYPSFANCSQHSNS
jgi:hypothetical protein